MVDVSIEKEGVKNFWGGKKLFHRNVWTVSFAMVCRTLFDDVLLFMESTLKSSTKSEEKMQIISMGKRWKSNEM